jgi:hypothetical protein
MFFFNLVCGFVKFTGFLVQKWRRVAQCATRKMAADLYILNRDRPKPAAICAFRGNAIFVSELPKLPKV